ncbi:hypothetical protein NJH83_03965 [Pseudomonas chlororaphis]|uniref:hypothetical protein n=1 Tax=Pseudomonas chlororaphis TaxID=587753 RepID=UPI00209B9433|nr:hypothetical protein [Pseudomonas chlororaphis]MCO7609376.1 hypothetical protein [Pseudomonas chlororaphis]
MSRPPVLLRLTPQAAGELHQQHQKANAELRALTRSRKEFERQVKTLIGSEAFRRLQKNTDNALLLADLAKEVA